MFKKFKITKNNFKKSTWIGERNGVDGVGNFANKMAARLNGAETTSTISRKKLKMQQLGPLESTARAKL